MTSKVIRVKLETYERMKAFVRIEELPALTTKPDDVIQALLEFWCDARRRSFSQALTPDEMKALLNKYEGGN